MPGSGVGAAKEAAAIRTVAEAAAAILIICEVNVVGFFLIGYP